MFKSAFLKVLSPSLVLRRSIVKCRYNWNNEGIQYPGFKYYPRYPDFKDPPYEPTKLFKVKRTKKMKGLPYWEKEILKEFKLEGNDYVIIKNIPENNWRLWKVKHAVEIVPVTFPDGFPKETDRTFLNEEGEMRIIRNLDKEVERLQLSEAFRKSEDRMDSDTIRRNLRKKWNDGWGSHL